MSRRSKEEIIKAIKSVHKKIGAEVLSQNQFFLNSDITISNILYHFPKWSDACKASGIKYDKSRDRIDDDVLLSDWGEVTRSLGNIPPLTVYNVKGKYSRNTFDRFGKWVDVPNAFKKFAIDLEEWQDVLEIIEQIKPKSQKKKVQRTTKSPNFIDRHTKIDNRQVYGDPIDFRGLRHEPVNEQGVVFLFGMVADKLGYLVESIQTGFPDCEAKRRISSGQWQRVKIEFEYESRNFVVHRHDPKKCDVIICWIDNWPECPKGLEIVALSEEIKKL